MSSVLLLCRWLLSKVLHVHSEELFRQGLHVQGYVVASLVNYSYILLLKICRHRYLTCLPKHMPACSCIADARDLLFKYTACTLHSDNVDLDQQNYLYL